MNNAKVGARSPGEIRHFRTLSLASKLLQFLFLFTTILLMVSLNLCALDVSSSREKLEQSLQLFASPACLYEEISIILRSDRDQKSVRRLRRYYREDSNTEFSHLLVFDYPEEMKGTVLLYGDRTTECLMYLPAINQVKKIKTGTDILLPGTDFCLKDWQHKIREGSVFNFLGERLKNRAKFAIIEEQTEAGEFFQHWIREEDSIRIRVDKMDRNGGVQESVKYHDFKVLLNNTWIADMIVKRSESLQHQSLVKVNRRVISEDYVPQNLFTPEYLESCLSIAKVDMIPQEDGESEHVGEMD